MVVIGEFFAHQQELCPMVIMYRQGDPGPDGCLGPILMFGPPVAIVVIAFGVIDLLPNNSARDSILAVLGLVGSFGGLLVGAWLYMKWATGEKQRERVEKLACELLAQNITTIGSATDESEQAPGPGLPGLEGLGLEQTHAVTALLQTMLEEAFERAERRSVRIQLIFFVAGLIFATPVNLLVIKVFH